MPGLPVYAETSAGYRRYIVRRSPREGASKEA